MIPTAILVGLAFGFVAGTVDRIRFTFVGIALAVILWVGALWQSDVVGNDSPVVFAVAAGALAAANCSVGVLVG